MFERVVGIGEVHAVGGQVQAFGIHHQQLSPSIDGSPVEPGIGAVDADDMLAGAAQSCSTMPSQQPSSR